MTMLKTPASLLIEAATKDINVQEIPLGSNSGPRINQMLALVGLGPGYYWCAAAVSMWMYEAAKAGGYTNPLPLTADCDVLLAKAKKLGILRSSNPQPGDLFLVLKPGDDSDAFHTGVVVKNNGDGTIETIEGNSNLDGSNNGYEVAHKSGSHSRTITSRLRFIHWQDLIEAAISTWIVTVNKVKLLLSFTDKDGSVWVSAREFVSALEGITQAKLVGYNASEHNLVFEGKDLPVQINIVKDIGYGRVRDLSTAFVAKLLLADNKAKTITVTK